MRLIDAMGYRQVLEEEKEFVTSLDGNMVAGLEIAIADLMDAPTIEAEPVRHGRWVWKHRHHGGFRKYMGVDEFGETHTITVDERSECDEPYCPYCGKWNESVFRNYCPNCGANMDGDSHE